MSTHSFVRAARLQYYCNAMVKYDYESDLKNALLREMIHVYICIKDNNINNHSPHMHLRIAAYMFLIRLH
jgi:hypothetical protein